MKITTVSQGDVVHINWAGLGRIEETQQDPRKGDIVRIISPIGLLFYAKSGTDNNKTLLLKGYSLREGFQQVPEQVFPFLDNSLQEQFSRGLPARSGLGFLIASMLEGTHGLLNVCVWNTRHRLLNQALYKFDLTQTPDRLTGKEKFDLTPINLDAEGSFCSTELRVVTHEARAFDKYYASTRQTRDVIAWARDVYPGGLV